MQGINQIRQPLPNISYVILCQGGSSPLIWSKEISANFTVLFWSVNLRHLDYFVFSARKLLYTVL